MKKLSALKITCTICLAILSLNGCAGGRGFLGADDDRRLPISNPFGNYYATAKADPNQKVTLRTSKGDRAVEVDLPSGQASLSEFVLPVSPAFKDTSTTSGRDLASIDNGEGESNPGLTDESYRARTQSNSDREILNTLPHTRPEDENSQREIENGLGLSPSEDNAGAEGSQSYLATVDHIKQLYRIGRFEAALLETDDAIRLYQTDPRLHQMRGTLLDRLGKRDLALRSWTQALRFDPGNASLKRFVERKQQQRSLAGQ